MKTLMFASWDKLLAHLEITECVAYHAPLDISPRHVRAKAFKNGKVRVWIDGGKRLGISPFTADSGHLSRFRRVFDSDARPTVVTADNYFDAASGLYWYCNDYHGGAASELYSIMSARLHYTPASSEDAPEAGTEAETFYADLEAGTWDATELLNAIDAAQAKAHG